MHCLHDWNIYYVFPEPGGSIGLCLILVSVAQTPSWDCIATGCHRTTCNIHVVTGCNWQRLAICPSGSLAHLRWVADILKFAWNAIQIDAIFNISPNMDQIVLLEYSVSTDDVHIKYIHHWQPPTTNGLFAKLISSQLHRQAGSQCLGQIMIWQ